MTGSELSQYLGIGIRRIEQLCASGILPKVGRDDYDLTACTRAYIDHLKKWKHATEFPVSMADLARCCGCRPEKISVLVHKGLIPKLGRGRYDLATGIQAFIHQIRKG